MAPFRLLKVTHFNQEAWINPGHAVLFHWASLASHDDLTHSHLTGVDHGLEEQGKQVNTYLFWREIIAIGVTGRGDLRAFNEVDDLDRIAHFLSGRGYPVIGDRDEPEQKGGETER